MKNIQIFLFEWKHFIRNPFKVIALFLFLLASIYGLHNGANLYHKQQSEIEEINQQVLTERQQILQYFEKGEKGPKDRSWVDITNPYWAMRYASIVHFKNPSPAMVYNIGQAEQFGFYKKTSMFSSPFDADMTKEIANPERLQMGTLDFSFTLLFIMPLVLLILIYNIKSYENERGFLSLILVQNTVKTNWLISRLLFYVVLLVVCIFLLLFYGAFLSPVFAMNSITFFEVAFTAVFYCLFWAVLFFFVLRSGKNILDNTLKMAGIYLLLTMVIPAAVHQWVSMEKPANLMTDFIDATREKKEALYDKPAEVLQNKLNDLFPEIQLTKIANDSSRSSYARNRAMVALTNELSKESIVLIASESQSKNDIVAGSYWFNPVMFFQNRMNMETKTHFQNYKNYRKRIQSSIDKQINLMVRDIYNDSKVTKERYLNYIKQSEKNE